MAVCGVESVDDDDDNANRMRIKMSERKCKWLKRKTLENLFSYLPTYHLMLKQTTIEFNASARTQIGCGSTANVFVECGRG